MIKENIDSIIAEAMKEGDKSKLKVFRLIKSEYQKFETAKDSKPLDDAAEIKILKKMSVQWEEEISMMAKAGRDVSGLTTELNILKSITPEEPSVEEQMQTATEVVEAYLTGLPVEERKTMKHLGAVMKIIKGTYPTIDGKLVSDVYKKLIGL